MKYFTELVRKENVAQGTMAFHFKLPEGFAWQAGQSMDLTILDPKYTDKFGNTRSYSIASAPYENEIMIATRITDTAFKKSLAESEVGQKFSLIGPIGNFVLGEDQNQVSVLLSGGIGITPFYSMIKDATENKLPNEIILFYSNKEPGSTAFLDKLEDLAKKNPHFKFIPTMTDVKTDVSWSGERGRIDHKLIEKYLPKDKKVTYYLTGPQDMVMAMRKVVEQEMGVSDDDIKTEQFSGY